MLQRSGNVPSPQTAVLSLLVLITASPTASAIEPCRITIIDDENEWPVPMVELRTTHKVRFVSDNAGIIAFDRITITIKYFTAWIWILCRPVTALRC